MPHPYFDVPIPIVIGHRGCAGEAPENTLVSFERALDQGAAILETDAHLTRDDVPVLMHDDDVGGSTEGAGRVSEVDLAELQQLDAGYRFSADGGRTHPYRDRGLRVPTLAQAFESFPEARFNIELKENLPGLVERTVAAVTHAGRADRTLLTAGDDTLMAELRGHVERCGANTALGACRGDVVAFIASAQAGSMPPPGVMALQVPAEFGGDPLVTPAFVEHAHAHDVHVHVWTINEPAEMRRLLALGVDGLVTDFPGRLAGVVTAWRAGS